MHRHHVINDLIWRALFKAGLPSIKESHGLLRSDNKRPDGLTLIPWRDGRCTTCDVTVTDIVVPSYLNISSACAASAAEAAAKRKEDKYTDIACNYYFFPSRHTVLLIRSVRTSSLLWAIVFYQSLMTHERHFSFSNVFMLQFNGLMLSASPIHSAILMWKCDVYSQPRHIVRDFFRLQSLQISNAFGNEVQRATKIIIIKWHDST